MPSRNLGILAHVDAGKTTLTERILFEAGVIAAIGRVDHGTTQTDTLELERQRGITIQSAVVSFRLGNLTVNLIDTPGHSDFIAEVDRALQVLDAVIVVISAVEGVQPQTRKLRAVRAAGLPLLIFANKIDRVGARSDALLAEIERTLAIRAVAMSDVTGIGDRSASVTPRDSCEPVVAAALTDVLAENDDAIIARFLNGGSPLRGDALRRELARQVHAHHVVPVFFGSAITGAGVRDLLDGVPALLGATQDRAEEPLSGMVFKIQRSPTGEKIALARLFGGALATRQQVTLHRPAPGGETVTGDVRITGIETFRDGSTAPATQAVAGDIVRLHGMGNARIGDILGEPPDGTGLARFAPPTLESVIRPRVCADAPTLNAALEHLAEADPLIGIRRSARDGSISLRLYGEVQKEVIAATLASEHGVAVEFEPSRVLCIERVTGSGEAGEEQGANPFGVTVFIRVEPGRRDSGITYHRELGIVPLGFYRSIEETIFATLEEGLHGWPVRDCVVTLTRVTYPTGSTAGDYRHLTPLVLMSALRDAGTEVCEPVARFTLDLPLDAAGEGYSLLATARAIPEVTETIGATGRITGTIPSAEVHRFEQVLPGIANGLAGFSTESAGYRAVGGDPPTRPRTDFNPLNRKLYLALVSQS